MVRLIALWAVFVASLILLVVLREERLARQGKVPLGRLRRLWFGKERRRAPRYRVDWPVRYRRLPALSNARQAGLPEPSSPQEDHSSGFQIPSSGFPARSRDLSTTGAGLVLKERLNPGERITLEFEPPGEASALGLNARVVWIREVPSGGERLFFMGAEFEALSPEVQERLAALIRSRLPLADRA